MSTDHRAETMSKQDRGAFETDTFHRMLVEAARYWVIEAWLRSQELPRSETRYVYPDGPPASMDWGNSPGPDDPTMKPMRGKRVSITIKVEDR